MHQMHRHWTYLFLFTDIDECEIGACVQNCINFNGGYNCSCFEGYALNSNDGRCEGKPAIVPDFLQTLMSVRLGLVFRTVLTSMVATIAPALRVMP